MFESECELKAAHRNKLRSILGDGLKVTIAHIACEKYFEQFTPGDRVEFSRIVWDGSDTDFSEEPGTFRLNVNGWKPETYKATFIRWNYKKKAVIQLDEPIKAQRKDGQGGWVDVEFRFIPIYPQNHPKGQTIKKIDEKPWLICKGCRDAFWELLDNGICKECNNAEIMIKAGFVFNGYEWEPGSEPEVF